MHQFPGTGVADGVEGFVIDKWPWLSVLLKVITDVSIPLFNYYFKYLGALYFIPIEVYVAVLGVISLAGLLWIEKRFRLLPVVPAPE